MIPAAGISPASFLLRGFIVPGLDYNTAVVLAGTGLLGLAAGVTGTFAVLRRRALLGDALAHAALPGLCIAFLIIQERSFPALLAGAFASSLLGMGVVSLITHRTRTKEDAAIGIVLSVFFGAGIVLLRAIQNLPATGSRAGLNSYIFGKTAGMIAQDVAASGILVLLVLGAIALFYKEFKILSFDADFAASLGYPVLLLDMLLLGLLTITIIVGLPAVGVVMMAALLILPGAAARFWTERLGSMLVFAGLFGLAVGLAGTLASSLIEAIDLPTGPTIVLSGSALFCFSMMFAPRRGALARALERLKISSRVEHQNFLRAAYEILEPRLPEHRPFTAAEVSARRRWPIRKAQRALRRAARRGLAAAMVPGEGWRLTDSGFRRAASITRSHRLWELYLIENAAIAVDHVDDAADFIEHSLPRDLVKKLEEQLRGAGRLPPEGGVPTSPHRLGEDSRP